jgi:hypothetical protein
MKGAATGYGPANEAGDAMLAGGGTWRPIARGIEERGRCVA